MKKDGFNKDAHRSFEEVLRQKLKEVDGKPSDRLWQHLELSLDVADKNKSAYFSTSRMLVAALLLLLLVGGVFTYEHLSQNKTSTADSGARRGKMADEAPSGATQMKKKGSSTNEGAAIAETDQNVGAIKTDAQRAPFLADSNVDKTSKPNSLKSIALANKTGANTSSKTLSAVSEKSTGTDKTVNSSTEADLGVLLKIKDEVRKEVASTTGTDLSVSQQEAQPHLSRTIETPVITGAEDSDKEPTEPTEKTNPTKNIVKKTNSKAGTISEKSTYEVATAPEALPADSTTGEKIEPESADDLLATADSVKDVRDEKRSIFIVGIKFGPSYFEQNIRLTDPSPNRPIQQSTITPQGSQPMYSSAAEDFDNNTSPALSYRAVLTIARDIAQGIKIETGIGFSHLAASTTAQYVVADTVLQSNGNIIYTNQRPLLFAALSPGEDIQNSIINQTAPFKITYQYRYLHLPLQLQVFQEARSWRYSISAGIEMYRLLQSNITFDDLAAQEITVEDPSSQYFRPWLVSGILTGGVGYNLSERLLLQLIGEANIFFTPITRKDEIQQVRQKSPRAYGINAGLTYALFRTKP